MLYRTVEITSPGQDRMWPPHQGPGHRDARERETYRRALATATRLLGADGRVARGAPPSPAYLIAEVHRRTEAEPLTVANAAAKVAAFHSGRY